MRTTIDIDDDLLAAAREIARREIVSAGQWFRACCAPRSLER